MKKNKILRTFVVEKVSKREGSNGEVDYFVKLVHNSKPENGMREVTKTYYIAYESNVPEVGDTIEIDETERIINGSPLVIINNAICVITKKQFATTDEKVIYFDELSFLGNVIEK